MPRGIASVSYCLKGDSMPSSFNRRSLIKGAAGVATAVAVSPAFHVPNVIAATGSTIEIDYWGAYTGNLGEAETKMVSDFNAAQQDVKVNYTTNTNYEQNAQKLTAALSSGSVPDVALLSDVWWFKFYLSQALAPLSDLLTAQSVDTTDYVDSLFNEGVREDMSYWIPFARSTPLFYYNKKILGTIGVTEAPKTWDEFIAYAPQLVKKDGDTVTQSAFAHATSGSYISWLFQSAVWQYGGAYSDADFNILIDQGGAIDAGNMFRDSVQNGWATTPSDDEADFMNGTVAAIMASTGSLAGITSTATFDFGTAFLPEGPAGFGCSTGGAGMTVLAKAPAERQEAAMKFIAWATSTEQAAWWSETTGYMPVRKSSRDQMADFFTKNPNFKVAVDQLDKTKPQDSARVFMPNGDQIIGKGLERITVNR